MTLILPIRTTGFHRICLLKRRKFDDWPELNDAAGNILITVPKVYDFIAQFSKKLLRGTAGQEISRRVHQYGNIVYILPLEYIRYIVYILPLQ